MRGRWAFSPFFVLFCCLFPRRNYSGHSQEVGAGWRFSAQKDSFQSVLLPSPGKVGHKQMVAQLTLTVNSNQVMKAESTLFIACLKNPEESRCMSGKTLGACSEERKEAYVRQHSLLHRHPGIAQHLWTSIPEENTRVGLSLPSHW